MENNQKTQNSETAGGDISRYILGNSTGLRGDNYNELDALVFAELSYARFEDVYSVKNMPISVSDFAGELAKHVKGTDNESVDRRTFLTAIADSERYKSCSVTNMAVENSESQWAALTIDMGGDASVIAMRGTDGTVNGWAENFELAYDPDGNRAQELSAEYLKQCESSQIYLTGHSKGGNDVMAGYVMNDQEVRDRVRHIHNFDGPGVNQEFRDRYDEGYMELYDKVTNYYPKNSVIGLLLIDNPGESYFIEADITGHTELLVLGEHDPFSFQISGGSAEFTPANQTATSRAINEILDNTLSHLSNRERKVAMEMIVSLGIPALIAEASLETAVRIITADIINAWLDNITGIDDQEAKQVAAKMTVLLWYNTHEYFYISPIDIMIAAAESGLRKSYDLLLGINNSIEEKIVGFRDCVLENIGPLLRQANQLLQDRRIFGGSALYGNMAYQVNPAVVRQTGETFRSLSTDLMECYREVANIQTNMSFTIRLGNSLDFMAIKNTLSQLSGVCRTCNSSLNKIADQYEETENKIVQQI